MPINGYSELDIKELLQFSQVEQVPVSQTDDVETPITPETLDDFIKSLDCNSKRADFALSEYDPKRHEITRRLDKYITKGKSVEDGGTGITTETVKQAKLAIPYQKKIVDASVTFLFGEPVTLETDSDDIKSIWKELRMDTINREVAEQVFSETESAKLFEPYRVSATESRLACIPIARSLGDTIYTRFNSYRQLTVFARGYKTKNNQDKETQHLDVYYPEKIYNCYKPQGESWKVNVRPNALKKIPVTYYSKPQSDWADVSPLIDRMEWLISTRADVNDYSGNPILVLTGNVASLPDKKEIAKVVQLEEGGKAEYLVPSMSREMVDSEYNTLKNLINECTDTPDYSIEKTGSIGQDSGKALEMRFYPATKKAKHNQGMFGEMLDREINIIKAYLSEVKKVPGIDKVEVDIRFGNPLPDQTADLLTMLQSACGLPVMSQRTAVANNPLVKNLDEEMAELESEQIEPITEIQPSDTGQTILRPIGATSG